jgi:hypothetical protein
MYDFGTHDAQAEKTMKNFGLKVVKAEAYSMQQTKRKLTVTQAWSGSETRQQAA